MPVMTYPFTEDEMYAAAREWGCNCGPSALAFALQVPLDRVRRCMYCEAPASSWLARHDELAACEEYEPRLWREHVQTWHAMERVPAVGDR